MSSKADKSSDKRKSQRKSKSKDDRRKSGKAKPHPGRKVAMEDLSYYEVLGVQPNADEAAIKKAYRRSAMKWHPDKNKDNEEEALEMFKLVAEAYEVLSDSEKRETYDRYGKDGLRNGAGGSQSQGFHYDYSHAQNLFEQFFANDPFFNHSFGDAFGMGGGMPMPRGFGGGFGFDADDFFSGFGDMQGSSQSFSSSSFGGSGGGGMSTSTRSVTTIVNGQRVTKTEKTIRYPDGRVETTTEETTGDEANRLGDRRSSGRRNIGWF